MKLVELREKCREYSLPVSGKKSELIQRIIDYLESERDIIKSNMEVETSNNTEDATEENTYDNTEEDTPNEENSVIIYPQEEAEIDKEQQQQETIEKEIESEKEVESEQQETEKENKTEMEIKQEPEAEAEENAEEVQEKVTVKHEDEGKGDDDDGEDNQRSNNDELPMEEKQKQEEEKIIEFKLYNILNDQNEREQNEKDREIQINKHHKQPVSLSHINDLLEKIVKKGVKTTPPPPPPPQYDEADLPILLDLSKKKPKKQIIDKSLEVKIIKIRNDSTNEASQQPPSPQQKTPITETLVEPIAKSTTETSAEEEERRILNKKIEKIQSVLKKKQEMENIFNAKAKKHNISPQNDKSDEPPLKKAKESDEKKDVLKLEVKKPSNLCGNINTFIINKESNNNNNNNNPTNLVKNIPTFIKPPSSVDDKKNKSLLNHKTIEVPKKYMYFSRDKNTKPSNTTSSIKSTTNITNTSSSVISTSASSTTTAVKKNKIVYPTTTKTHNNNNNNNNKYISHEIQQEPPPPPPPLPPKSITTTAKPTTTSTLSKYSYFSRKETKDVKPAIKEEPVKEEIKEVINVDEPKKSPKDTESAKNSHSSNNANQDLSWADPEKLMKTLEEQSSIIDLDELFGEVTTCDIDEIFPNRHPKPRGSSGNWLNDAVTQEEEEKYKIETSRK